MGTHTAWGTRKSVVFAQDGEDGIGLSTCWIYSESSFLIPACSMHLLILLVKHELRELSHLRANG